MFYKPKEYFQQTFPELQEKVLGEQTRGVLDFLKHI